MLVFHNQSDFISDLRGKTRTVVFKYTGTISRQDLGNDASALNLRSVYNAAQNAYQGLSISQPLQVGEFESLPSDFNDASKPLIVIAQIEGTLGSKRTTITIHLNICSIRHGCLWNRNFDSS